MNNGVAWGLVPVWRATSNRVHDRSEHKGGSGHAENGHKALGYANMRRAEYDVLVVCKETVLVNETKSSLRPRDADELADKLREFRGFFPEYTDRKVIGVLASLSADESMVRYAGSMGILVMAMGAETMEVLNPESARAY